MGLQRRVPTHVKLLVHEGAEGALGFAFLFNNDNRAVRLLTCISLFNRQTALGAGVGRREG